MRFRFNIRHLRQHPVELLATAARGALTDITIRIQHGHLLGEGRRDELLQRDAVILRKRLRATVKGFWNIDLERTHRGERLFSNPISVTARIPDSARLPRATPLCSRSAAREHAASRI